jgi:pyridoxine 5-phosphate synthase
MTRLHINVDHVATLRQQRNTLYPDPVTAALLAELAGVEGITVHLREDRRHIQPRDVKILRQSVQTTLNLEMAATEAMVAFALELKPDVCTLVPEKREEQTTEGGLDVVGNESALRGVVEQLQGAGIKVSLFIDPGTDQVRASQAVGAQQVELHTGDYCNARGAEQEAELQRLIDGAAAAAEQGLAVAAGHGLSYTDVGPVAAIPQVEELNIGHGIVARAVLVGIERAVIDMREAIDRAQVETDQ